MPVDDRDDERPQGQQQPPSSPENKESVRGALQSETDDPLPPVAERLAERDADRAEPVTPQGRRRRYLTRRNAFIATVAVAAGALALALIAVLAYRLGYVDRYVARQIKDTLATYGIRAEIKEFETRGARTVEMRDIELYDAQSGAKLGEVDRLLAEVRIEDLYALNLRRSVNLKSLIIDGLEAWVTFDGEGRSNFRNIKLPAPAPNRRILFSYSTAEINVKNSVIHYGDERFDIAGHARDIVATIRPENPAAPAEGWSNVVTLAAANSTFVYNDRPVNDISINARGRINQTRADIEELILRSPLAEARLQGVMDDWRALRYRMQVTSTVDLTQASDILQAGTALRGVGNFAGTVAGEGTRYQVDGQIVSDALAADGVRLKALNVTARGAGDGASYEAQGRAVAELLTAGDFQLNTVQLVGNVRGTGADFRWLGELRAAAASAPGATIAGLILSDVVAESRDDVLTASASRASAGRILVEDASVEGAQASNLRLRNQNDVTTASAAAVQAGTVTASGARVSGVTATGVEAVARDNGTTDVTAEGLRVGGINAAGTQVGSLNIAGVRLAIRDGRIQGTSGDINAGTVTVAGGGDLNGRVENVRLARPVFTVEPQGRYRASADLSLGGGVLGQVKLGAARGALVASNNQIQLNNFTADIFDGRATGNATVSTARGGASRVTSDFSDLNIDQLAALSGRVVPVSGRATGRVDLTFPGTQISAATGTVRADFAGETGGAGGDASGRTPLTGEVALRADRGLFQIERADLRTGASELSASGQFTFDPGSDASNLRLNLASSDAAELQRVLIASGLLPEVEDQLRNYGVEFGGKLAFEGALLGNLSDPTIDGRASLDSLILQGRDLGALTATLNVTPALIRVADGRLTERDGGGIQFALDAPRAGENNINLNATLDRASAGNLLAALPVLSPDARARLGDTQSDVSGSINVTGLPDAMAGEADLRFGAGRLGGEPFETITARATFNGPKINLESVDARFAAGRVTAAGDFDTSNQAFDIRASGTNIQLARLAAFAGGAAAAAPQVSGLANIEARATGVLTDFSTYEINFDGQGRDVIINGRPAGTLALTGRTENNQLDVRFTTDILGQPQVVAARVNLADESLPTTIETSLTGADLTPLFALILRRNDVTVTGRATGTLAAKGTLITKNEEDEDVFSLAGLRGTARFSELTVQVLDIRLSAVDPLLVQFQSNEVFFEKTQFTGPGTNVTFGGRAALGAGGTQNLTVDGRLNLRVLNGLSPDTFVSGTADVAVRVGGTFDQPRITGTAEASGASVSTLIGDERLTASNLRGRVIFNSSQVQIASLSGVLGGGSVSVTGGAQLAGFALANFRFNVRADDITVPFPEDFRSTADADLEVTGTRREQLIRGTVNLRRAEYTEDIELVDIIDRRRQASLTEGGGGESSFAATTRLDLRVEGRDALVVRNNLADAAGSVSLRVAGTLEDPNIYGRITATRGTLNFRDERYELTRAFIDLPAGRDADPLINIQAEAEIRGYRVIVGLTGPLSQPQAVVRSDPSLPQADVVALVTTGNLSTGETGASTLAQSGLGTAASLLTDTLVNAPARRATDRLFGLNRFELDPVITGRGGASPTARLTVGRQINRDLSITYSTNLTSDQNQVLALEYRVSNRLSFVAQYEQGSVSGFSSRNDNFSFEIRFRKRF